MGFLTRTTSIVTLALVSIGTVQGCKSSNGLPTAPTPSQFAATPNSPTQINLTWTSSITSGQFTLERSTDGVHFNPLATLPAGTLTYSDAGLSSGIHYTYRIQTLISGESSSPPVQASSEVAGIGSWTQLTHAAPNGVAGMLLLTDGTVMMQQGGVSNTWYKLTPDSTGNYINGTWSTLAPMSISRLYYASGVLPSGKVYIQGGEYVSTGASNSTGEIYDPVADTWSPVGALSPAPLSATPGFCDGMSQLLANGLVLMGWITGPQTYLYHPATNTFSSGATKLYNDSSDEESWVKLPDGSILSWGGSPNSANVPNAAQRFVPSLNQWVDAGNTPDPLENSAGEFGPGLLLPSNGKVFVSQGALLKASI